MASLGSVGHIFIGAMVRIYLAKIVNQGSVFMIADE